MNKYFLLFTILFSGHAFAKKCHLMPIISDDEKEISIHFYQELPQKFDDLKENDKTTIKKKCWKVFLEILGDNKYGFKVGDKDQTVVYVIDERFSPINRMKKFKRELEDLSKRRDFDIVKEKENGLLKVTVTR